MHLNIFVSNQCFNYCLGCYSYSREEKKGCYLRTSIIINFLKYAYSLGIHKVTLCGGDPLTRKDILSLIKNIKKIGFYISIDTVGNTIIHDFKVNNQIAIPKIDVWELSKYVDVIGIPIDGSTSDIINYFRNTKNNDIAQDQIKICQELINANANICINTVVNKGNINDAVGLSNIIIKLKNVKKWQIFEYIPSGFFGEKYRERFEISDEQFLKFKSDLIEIVGDKVKLEFKDVKRRNKLYMLIDNSGNAFICNFDSKNREIVGNINNVNDWSKICDNLLMSGKE